MCARVRSIKDSGQLPRQLQDLFRFNWPYNPNVAPTDAAPVLTAGKAEGRTGRLARFGLVHPWAKDLKGAARFINARSDTIREKPAFAKAYRARRCIVPVEGFYEWKTEGGRKQPYLFHRKDGGLLNLAGIWESAEIEGERIYSFSIVTGDPNDLIAAYHDRMPVAVADDKTDAWLDPDTDALADPGLALDLAAFAVRPMNPAMNNVRLKDAAAMEPETTLL